MILLCGIYINKKFLYLFQKKQDITVAPVPLPSTTQTGQDVSTRYYWVLSYSHWLNLVNNAFTAAIADLQAQMAAYVTSLGFVPGTLGTVPSVMSYNPSNNLFTLYSSRYSFGGAFVGGATSFGTNFQESAQCGSITICMDFSLVSGLSIRIYPVSVLI